MKIVKLEKYGGPEVLELTEAPMPEPAQGEVVVEIKAIGVNYADTARREGQYVVPTPLPFTPGAEIAGTVSAVGGGVTRFKPGARVVALIESGGYAEYVTVAEQTLIPVPDGVPFEQAVALPLQGLSAYHILKTMGRVEPGETVLVHAAAGGVGTLAVQLAKIFGAGSVIATASTDEKLEHARSLGADHLVNYTEAGWEDKVKELTGGKGVDVALEMVGGEVFHQTLRCLAPFGRLVIFGAASGEQAQFQPGQLMRKNQSVVGFFLPQIMRKPDLFRQSLGELLEWTGSGKLKLTVGGTYPLAEAADVHRQLQGRKTIGKLVLVP
ncbi:quinone oxidoreductase family protein [Planococcus lenghuensis]|uniref:Alcohol dehydrogenase n=1 Tax=Planococcus lenghuensis TaxID=2213202 RepID=A0A1Q2KUT6_9BACL|nr:NADPH:quinone oxidoreductase family protein [Planococcus lenghuensis]AQQ51975.1 alcohol dehydrogenase [Planococcus lenghuensis]